MRLSSHCWEVAYNKAFKRDSLRLAVSLRSSIAKRASHLNAALYALVNLGNRKDAFERSKNS